MKGRHTFVLAVTTLVIFSGYAALFIAPDEKTMHEIQRIFYYHVPSAISAFIAFFIVFLGSVAFLVTRDDKWDILAASAAEVGVACSSIVLITGPIWARPVWGIWWTWDARLTSTFVLWLLYISYLILRGLLEDPQRRATLSAIFGIFAFLDVPLVYLSNRLWRTQHPQPVLLGGQNSGLAPGMGQVLLICFISIACVMIVVLMDRYQLGRLARECEQLRYEVESRTMDPQSASRGAR
jgi:heme exporter protein C